MLVQNVSSQNYNTPCNFKSVYPVYHWCKINGKYKPATNQDLVHHCQRLLTSMLNNGGYRNPATVKKSAIGLLSKFIASIDSDYKYVPFVRSFYNNCGGYKNSVKSRGIEPMAYLITGNDAAEFEQVFGKPIGAIKNDENYSEKDKDRLVTRAKVAYASKGPLFVKSRCVKFVDRETGKPLELHAIFDRSDKSNPLKLIRCGFFIEGAKDNPLITNGIID